MRKMLLLAPLLLTACGTNPWMITHAPRTVSPSDLCRSLLTTTDPAFRLELQEEAARRGTTEYDCRIRYPGITPAVIPEDRGE